MKMTKSRLREIIKEEIQNFKKEQIREFISTGTGMGGAKKKGYESPETRTAQADYDAALAAHSFKVSAEPKYTPAGATKPVSAKWRRSIGGRGYAYSDAERIPPKAWEANQ